MTTNKKRKLKIATVGVIRHEQIRLMRQLKDKGYSNVSIAHIMNCSESTVRVQLSPRQIEL